MHNKIHNEIELDACLQGLGARWGVWGNRVCAAKLPTTYANMTIGHYEMLNIMVDIQTWGTGWSGKTVLIHCDNEAVVTVLTKGRTKDLTLAAIARHIWLKTAEHDICMKTMHIRGKDNIIADSLSRWFTSDIYKHKVMSLMPHLIWDEISPDSTIINWEI